MNSDEDQKRRTYGQHYTSTTIFEAYIFPEIKDCVYEYTWVDLFAGEGNLILPILNHIPLENRILFFEKHIYLFDIQSESVQQAINNAIRYGIPQDLAEKHIQQRDSLKDYPTFLFDLEFPPYHITNPPYLYIGYIVKTPDAQKHLEYFKGKNEGYQDLCQLALINDLRNKLQKMVYIIPSNFIFGNSISNKIRDDFFPFYHIQKAYIFEKKIFEQTGTNVIICFFNRKKTQEMATISFRALKLGAEDKEKEYNLDPKYHYKAGNDFDMILEEIASKTPLETKFYLMQKEIDSNSGENALSVIDANGFRGGAYQKLQFQVNDIIKQKVCANELWVRTVDTGGMDGRAGLYSIRDSFNVDGILVTKATYRTHPIQLFISPTLNHENQILLKDYFNQILEYLREETDSEFMTTYKYSGAEYTRKYFGLSQAKKIIATFPINDLNLTELNEFQKLVEGKQIENIIGFLKQQRKKSSLEVNKGGKTKLIAQKLSNWI